MAYDLHITRQEAWFEDDPERKIALEEWLAIIESDPQLRLDEECRETIDGVSLHGALPGTAVWTYGAEGEKHSRFHYSDGNIDARNPDEESIAQMLRIADKLGAKVVGDDDELHRSESVPETPLPAAAPEAKKKPWWKMF